MPRYALHDKWEAEGPYYYDLEGNKLDGDDVSKTVYTCQVEVEEAAPLPQAEANEYLKRVTVKVSNKRGAKVNFLTPHRAKNTASSLETRC